MSRQSGITKIKKGKYRVRIARLDPRTGKRKEMERTVNGTLAEARAKREELMAVFELGMLRKKRPRLGTYARLWLTTRLPTIKASTARKYANDLEEHILPELGDYYVDSLVPDDIRLFLERQLDDGCAHWSVFNRLRLLRSLAKDVHAEQTSPIDFCARVRMPMRREEQKEPVRLTADELRSLIKAVPAPWKALVVLLASTAMRWGEATGLKWEDVDFERLAIHIRRTNWKGTAQTPKTPKSRRCVPIASELAGLLHAHRAAMVQTQHPGVASGWVFPTQSGGLHKGTPLRKVLNRACEAAKVPRVKVHELRHTAVNLARQVVPAAIVKAMAGHTTDRMHEHYSGISLEEKRRAAEGILSSSGEEVGIHRTLPSRNSNPSGDHIERESGEVSGETHAPPSSESRK